MFAVFLNLWCHHFEKLPGTTLFFFTEKKTWSREWTWLFRVTKLVTGADLSIETLSLDYLATALSTQTTGQSNIATSWEICYQKSMNIWPSVTLLPNLQASLISSQGRTQQRWFILGWILLVRLLNLSQKEQGRILLVFWLTENWNGEKSNESSPFLYPCLRMEGILNKDRD